MLSQLQLHLFIYLLSFLGIWIGSGFVIKSVSRISGHFRISSFIVSFIVLGAFTSVSEFSVGVNAILENDPEIYVGNLVGASMILFMLIIPLLAIVGKSVRISPELQGFNLPASLVVIAAPAALIMDGVVGRFDAILALVVFVLLLVGIQSKGNVINNLKEKKQRSMVNAWREMVRVLFGVAIIFISSRLAVEQTEFFSNYLNISPFLVSLVLVSVGTNLPELSLVVRSAFLRNHQIAFGDYVGSAAFNTFLFAALSLFYKQKIVLTNSYAVSLVFLVVALALFYYFARTKNTISRLEAFTLLLTYITFLVTEYLLNFGLYTSTPRF